MLIYKAMVFLLTVLLYDELIGADQQRNCLRLEPDWRQSKTKVRSSLFSPPQLPAQSTSKQMSRPRSKAIACGYSGSCKIYIQCSSLHNTHDTSKYYYGYFPSLFFLLCLSWKKLKWSPVKAMQHLKILTYNYATMNC